MFSGAEPQVMHLHAQERMRRAVRTWSHREASIPLHSVPAQHGARLALHFLFDSALPQTVYCGERSTPIGLAEEACSVSPTVACLLGKTWNACDPSHRERDTRKKCRIPRRLTGNKKCTERR